MKKFPHSAVSTCCFIISECHHEFWIWDQGLYCNFKLLCKVKFGLQWKHLWHICSCGRGRSQADISKCQPSQVIVTASKDKKLEPWEKNRLICESYSAISWTCENGISKMVPAYCHKIQLRDLFHNISGRKW